MSKHSIHEELTATIEELEIIDSHEHLPMEDARPQDKDVLSEWLTHYFSCDLISAGLSDAGLAEARDSSKNLASRWKLVEPYWEAARSTGYGRSLDIAARGIYGIYGINGRTIGELKKAFLVARQNGGHYQRVLKEKSHIALSVDESNLDCDRAFFASAFRFDNFIMPTHRCQIRDTGRAVGVEVHNLEDWEEAMKRQLTQAREKGAVVFKHGLAYTRSLHYGKPSRAEAETDFNEFFKNAHAPFWRGGAKAGTALQDYMMHAILRQMDQQGLTLQVHTGLRTRLRHLHAFQGNESRHRAPGRQAAVSSRLMGHTHVNGNFNSGTEDRKVTYDTFNK